TVTRPRRELLAHRRITLAPGARQELSFEVPLSAFEFWDVARGAWRREPGPYDVLVGASSEDIRLRTTIVLDGEPHAPRAVLRHGLDAADFDEQSGVAIVDRTKVSGDAVTPAAGRSAALVYREVTVCVAGEGVVEVSLDGGVPLAALTPDPAAASDDPYAYTTLVAGLVAEGEHDVHIRLRGPLRLAHVGFSG
ncbi:MAG: sugar hydrolase, partial [Streptomycetaceae bacterium]|nr:sugar hydrolase [Streptomycetaceae bacterium]